MPVPRPLAALGAAGRALRAVFLSVAGDVWRAFRELVAKGILPVYLGDSLQRYVAGVAVGTCSASAAGLLSGSPPAARILAPGVNFLFAIVEGRLDPDLRHLVGLRPQDHPDAARLRRVLSDALQHAGRRAHRAAGLSTRRVARRPAWQVIAQVILPSALPNIITGFRVGAGFAFRGLIFAEIVAAKTGIGYLIFEGVTNQQPRAPSSA